MKLTSPHLGKIEILPITYQHVGICSDDDRSPLVALHLDRTATYLVANGVLDRMMVSLSPPNRRDARSDLDLARLF